MRNQASNAILLQFSRWNVGQFNFNVLLNAFSMTAIAARLFNANKAYGNDAEAYLIYIPCKIRSIALHFHKKKVR